MKISTGFTIVILCFLGIVYLFSELDLASAPAQGQLERPVVEPTRKEAGQPASKSSRKVAKSPAEKPAPEPPVKLASVPDTKPELLSRGTHTALLRSKKKLTNADIPASWLKEVRRPPDPAFLERRKRRDQQIREEIKLRYEVAKLQAEEAERKRQLQLEERRVAALEMKTVALENLAWSWWWPRGRGYRKCRRRRERRADDHCRYKMHPYRTISVHNPRWNYHRGSRGCSGYSRVQGSGGIHFFGSVN